MVLKVKAALLLLLLLIGCAAQKNSETKTERVEFKHQLEPLKPHNKKSSKVLGKLKVQLLNKSGRVLQRASAMFGNCEQCIRGYELKNLIGVRIVGTNPINLKAIREHSKGVKIIECPQGKTFTGEFSCGFLYQQKRYRFTFQLE
jgi:hypothetical protein